MDKHGIQISCTLGKHLWCKPETDATVYIDTTQRLSIVGLNLLVFARWTLAISMKLVTKFFFVP